MTEHEGWWDEAELYESYLGRWSFLAAQAFVNWLMVPAGRRWIDVGCGTGALCRAILAHANPIVIHGVDLSPLHIAYARGRVPDDRVRFEVADALALPYENGSYDVLASGLLLNMVHDPCVMVAEMVRVAKRGGCVAAYVWDYAGEMQPLRHFWDAAVALNPGAAAFDEGCLYPSCRPEMLQQLFADAGLVELETSALDVPAVFRDFTDYWKPFLGGHGLAPGYAMSLSERDRAVLREYLRARLRTAPDGSIRLVARAWAVCGIKP